MAKFLLVISATVRSQLRWARQHIYYLLILSPLVVGLTYATIARLDSDAPAWQPSITIILALAILAESALVGLSLSRATVEIYHLHQPESFLEYLPVPSVTHLQTGLVKRMIHTMLAAALLLGLRSLLYDRAIFDRTILFPLGLFIALTSLAEVWAALHWIHWSHTKDRLALIGGIIVLLPSIILASMLTVLMISPEASAFQNRFWPLIASGVGTLILTPLTYWIHDRWRTNDVEYARRLHSTSKRNDLLMPVIRRRFDPIVGAQLLCDIQLTLRAFSSAVYVAFGVSSLWLVALIATLTTDWLPVGSSEVSWLSATWLPPVFAIKLACILVTATQAAQLPMLVAYELPHLWLERSVGTSGLRMWQAKIWYTRLMSAPAPLAVWLVGLATGQIPLFYILPLLIECLWLWWLVSSIIGSLSFEVPDRPDIAITFMMVVGMALGLLSATLWPFGLAIYGYGIPPLTQRGCARAQYFLLTGGD